ncbi:MAG: hypothetical protein Q8O76_14655, partial [Chloroflexota bacterium]|nr:hypothetical protein [Chloroflexota bacterium]
MALFTGAVVVAKLLSKDGRIGPRNLFVVSGYMWVVPPDRPLVFVVNESQSLEEIVRQAIRIGYDDLAGYLQGGLKAWKEAGYPVATSELTTIDEVHRHFQEQRDGIVLDVRQDAEWREATSLGLSTSSWESSLTGPVSCLRARPPRSPAPTDSAPAPASACCSV